MKSAILVAACAAFVAFAGAAYAEPAGDGDKPGVDAGEGGSITDFFSSGTETKVTSGQDSSDINEVQMEAYNGPKARVAVARFTDKTGSGWYSFRIGDGMADQMATALFNSNRYIVLERQNLDVVLYEQDLGDSGRVRQDTAAAIGEIEGAELLITGAITEFQANSEGTQASGSTFLGGALDGVFGAITGGYRKAHMAIDVRVIDARTSRIVAATSVEGEATDVNLGGALAGASGGSALSGALSSWKNTPIEKAMRICIQRAVEFIASKTPAVYYRNGSGAVAQAASGGTQTAAVQPRAPAPVYDIGSVIRVKSSKVNMRGGPSTGHGVLASLTQDTPLLVKQQSGDWVQVRTTDGIDGWLAAWLTYPDSTLSAKLFEEKVEAVPEPTPAALTVEEAAPAASEAAPEEPAAAAVALAAPAATSGSSDKALLKEKLRTLKEFFDEGLITEEEYNAKRQEILAQF
jgi:curli biogenesis system outer membrane secretion channel CsgG